MAHLLNEAHPEPQTKPQPREVSFDIAKKCLKVRVILDGAEFYVPLKGGFGINEQPPFQFRMPVAYSVLPQPVGGVQRHDLIEIFATGVRTEVVDLPTWWDHRDNGVI